MIRSAVERIGEFTGLITLYETRQTFRDSQLAASNGLVACCKSVGR